MPTGRLVALITTPSDPGGVATRALALRRARDLRADPARISYLIPRGTLIPTPRPRPRLLRVGPVEGRILALLSAGNPSATIRFGIPSEQVVGLGAQVEAWAETGSPPASCPSPGDGPDPPSRA